MFLLCLQLLSVMAATNVKLYLNPASQTEALSQKFTVDIRLTAQDAYYIGYVKASLTFPANLVHVAKIDNSGSDFATEVNTDFDNSAGTITVVRKGTPYSTGDKLVSRVTFKTIQNGTASVQFTSKSQASYYSYSANMLTAVAGGTYTIGTTSSTPPPPSNTTPPPSSSPTPSPTPNPTPSFTPQASTEPASLSTDSSSFVVSPQDNGLNIINFDTNASYTSGQLKWQTTLPSTAEIQYGNDETNLSNLISINQPSVDFSTTLPNLQPGHKYFFNVVANAQGKQVTASGYIIAKGYPVAVFLQGLDNKPVKNASVQIGGVNQKTTESGKASFGMPAGDFNVHVSLGKVFKDFKVTIKDEQIPVDGSDPTLQSFNFRLPVRQKPGWLKFLQLFGFIVSASVFSLGVLLIIHGRLRGIISKKIHIGSADKGSKGASSSKLPELAKQTHSTPLPPRPVPPLASALAAKVTLAKSPPPSYPVNNHVAPAPPIPDPVKTSKLHPHTEAKTVQPTVSPPKPTPARASDEPKDIFEMAEERFEHDERLKSFVKKP